MKLRVLNCVNFTNSFQPQVKVKFGSKMRERKNVEKNNNNRLRRQVETGTETVSLRNTQIQMYETLIIKSTL